MTEDRAAVTTAELRKLLEEGTPGPWVATAAGSVVTSDREWQIVAEGGVSVYDSDELPVEQTDANNAFIAAARNALPSLLDALDAADRIAAEAHYIHGERCESVECPMLAAIAAYRAARKGEPDG